MTYGKVWAVSDDGAIEYISLTKEFLESSLIVLRESFFKDENVSIAVELHKSPNGRKELEGLSLNAAKDAVSVIAVEKATGKVAGVAFNKIQVLDTSQETYFENYFTQCKEDSSKALIQFMIDADGACNLFEELKTDCLLELMFLATLPEFRRRGIGRKLCEATIELARCLKKGEYKKISVTDEPVTFAPPPKVVSTIFSTFITQKIGRQLGLKISKEISFEKFVYQGRTFASRIDPSSPTATVEYIIL